MQRRAFDTEQAVASEHADDISSSLSRVKQDLQQTSEDIGDAMRHTGDRLSSTSHQTADTVRDVAHTARTKADNVWDKAREQEAFIKNTGRSWFSWVTGSASRGEGSDEAREQQVANTASDIAASSQGARREFSNATDRAGRALGDMADAATDTVQRTASETMNATSSRMDRLKGGLQDGYEDAKEHGRSFMKQTMDGASDALGTVEEHASAAHRAMADRAQQVADDVDGALRRTPDELAEARAADTTVQESRELAWEAGGPEGGGLQRTSRRVGMDPYNEPKWLRNTGVNYGHNSQNKWLD